MKTKQSLFRVLFLGPALLATCIGQTAEYYVSPTGDDASNGSQDSPFATVAKGVSRLQAGDTLYLREGDHYISSPIEMYTIKGTPEKPITIRNYPNENPILKGCRPIGTDGWVRVTEEDRNYQAFFKRAANGVTPAELQNICKKRIESNIFDLYIDNEGKDGEKHWSVIRYYLLGLPLLDEEMEWGFDMDEDGEGGTVYVWTKGGSTPDGFACIDGRVVEHVFVGGPARKGDKFDRAPFFGNATEYVTFDGLTILGGAILMSRTKHVTVRNCEFLYFGSHFFALKSARDPVTNNVFLSQDFKFFNNIVRYGQNQALVTEGSKHLVVENNLIEHTSFGGTGTMNFADVEFPVFRYNTVRWSGGSTTITFNNGSNPPEIPEVCEYNYLEHIGRFQSDGAAIQRIGRGAANFVFRYNWILHGGRMGIRCDFNTNPIILAHMYRNLVWDTKHNMGFNCEYANIFSNTSFESHDGSDMRYPRSQGAHFPNQNQFTISRNNLGDRIEVTHPMTAEDHFWNGVDRNLLTRCMLRDVQNKDFRPRHGAPIIDAGTVFPKTRWANPGIVETDIYSTVDFRWVDPSDPRSEIYVDPHWPLTGPGDIASHYQGSAPDIGMYEYGDDNYFIPGRREVNASHPIPPNGTGTAKPDCDLMWRPARDGQTYHVYFGRSRNDLALMNSQTNNIYDPGMLTYGQEYFWRVDTVTSASPNPIPGDVWSFTVEPAFGNVTMEAGAIAVDAQWRTVSLANKYLNPVVVCTVQLNANIHPVVARVRNARAHSFDLCLQNSSGKPVTDDTVHYLVVEEGPHRLPNGAGIEAKLVTFESEAGTGTLGKRVDFNVNFSRPVVFGQVMTCNDPVCSASWNRFQDLPWWHSSALMDSRYCYVGYHTGRNTDGAVNGETLGVIILEAGMGEIGGVKYEINRKDDKDAGIRGVMDKDAPYGTELVEFDETPRWGIATRTGMEHPADEQGGQDDFSWAVLHGESPLVVDRIQLSLDEFDGCDRKVTDGKKFSYFVLENSLRFDGTAPSNQRFPRRATPPPAQEE